MLITVSEDITNPLSLWEEVQGILERHNVTGLAVAIGTSDGITTHSVGMDSSNLHKVSELFALYASGVYADFTEN